MQAPQSDVPRCVLPPPTWITTRIVGYDRMGCYIYENDMQRAWSDMTFWPGGGSRR